jgi:hypothetical protein
LTARPRRSIFIPVARIMRDRRKLLWNFKMAALPSRRYLALRQAELDSWRGGYPLYEMSSFE